MRGIHFFAATLVAAGACGLVVACGSDDTTENSTDGGANDATSDVAKSDSSTPLDSGGDAGPKTVTVHAVSDRPIAGAVVVFFDPSGAPSSPMTTAADGTVTAAVAAGSSVTVSIHDTNDYELTSFLGIEPGDDLYAYSNQSGKVRVVGELDVPAPGGDAGTTNQWNYSAGCGYVPAAVGSGATITLDPSCTDGGSVNGMAWALAPTGTSTAFASAGNIPLVDGGASLGSWNWVTATDAPFTTTGARDPNATEFSTVVHVRGGSVTYAWFLQQFVNLPGDGGGPGPLSVGLPGSIGFIDNVVATAGLDFAADSTSNTGTTGITTVDAPGEALAVDFAEMPPHLHDPMMSFDSGTNKLTVSWTADGATTSLEGSRVLIDWEFNSPDGGANSNYSWTIIGPTGTTVTTPKLTSDLAPAFPNSANTTPLALDSMYSLGGSLVPTYAVFRNGYATYAVPYQLPAAHGTVKISAIDF